MPECNYQTSYSLFFAHGNLLTLTICPCNYTWTYHQKFLYKCVLCLFLRFWIVRKTSSCQLCWLAPFRSAGVLFSSATADNAVYCIIGYPSVRYTTLHYRSFGSHRMQTPILECHSPMTPSATYHSVLSGWDHCSSPCCHSLLLEQMSK